jgi:endonuclease/exonuclease/phosphatase (EEP) superfamily protein YafD
VAVALLFGLLGLENYWACMVESLSVPLGFLACLWLVFIFIYKKFSVGLSGLLWLSALTILSYKILSSQNQQFACPEASILVLQANVYQFNENRSACLRQIAEKQADILILHEISQGWLKELELLGYPYSMLEMVPDSLCCYGMGIFSKSQLQDTARLYAEHIAILKAKIEGIEVLTTHFRNPAILHKYRSSKKQMAFVAQWLNRLPSPKLFVGDFNAVPWDGRMKDFFSKTGLKDTRSGFGATYRYNFAVLPIDYILIDSCLCASGFESIRLKGSDHFGIAARIGKK